MQILKSSIEEINHVLGESSHEELRAVEDSLRQLSRAQIQFLRDTLESARHEGRVPLHHITFIEYLLQEWWEHSLSTKMAVIARVVSLSELGSWPGETLGDHIIGEKIEDFFTVAAASPSDYRWTNVRPAPRSH